MKVTKAQYEKALAALPKLRAAEATVNAWNEAIKAIGPVAEHMDITEVGPDGTFTGKPKETRNASAGSGSGKAA